jgi:hypothetical protein
MRGDEQLAEEVSFSAAVFMPLDFGIDELFSVFIYLLRLS